MAWSAWKRIALRLACAVCLCAKALPGGAQAVAAGGGAGSAGRDAERVAPVHGFNVAVTETGQHNSATGWAVYTTPSVFFRFNENFSVSGSVPWYSRVNAFVPVNVNGNKTDELRTGKNLLGDAAVGATYERPRSNSNWSTSATIGFPTGNDRFGLSANSTTYNVTTHLEHTFGLFTPDVEIGDGNSSNLVNRSVKKAYTAVGQMANFQAGTSVDLPLGLSLDLEAYEDLPIGNQNVYGTVTHKTKKGKTVTKQVLEGAGLAEDNGLTSELDLPLGGHFTLQGTYERSIRQSLDTASVGLTWIARRPSIRLNAGE